MCCPSLSAQDQIHPGVIPGPTAAGGSFLLTTTRWEKVNLEQLMIHQSVNSVRDRSALMQALQC